MDPNSELMSVTQDSLTLTDGNIYAQIYLDLRQDPDAPVLDCNSVKMEQFDSTTDGSLNIIYEREIPLLQEQMLYKPIKDNIILNSNATEDESMAVEALRQLGNSAVHTKIPPDLPLLPCSNCDTQFQTTADFQNHSAMCKQSPLRCYVCNEIFDRTVDFNNHVVGHAVDRPHSCRMCSMLFVQEKDLVEHLQSHISTDTNQCKVCGVTFQRPSSLTNHMKIHTYQPGRAVLNSFVLPKPDVENCTSISDEINTNSKSITLPSLNNWEDYGFGRTEDFYVNLEVAQEMTIGNFEEGKNNVVAVSYEFVNYKSVGHEEEISSTEAILPQASPVVENKRPYLCKYCNKSFAREKALLSHHKLHSSILQTYYQCKNCDGCLTDEESLINHSSNCGGKIQESNEKILNVNTPTNDVLNVEKQRRVLIDNPKAEFYKHICTHCEKRFSTKQKLHRHMWIHRKKTFTCEICASSFEKQEELDTHRLSTHQGNSAYVCTECGKCFSSRQGLWEHNRVHAETSHLYKCVECTKTFSSRQGYLIHKRAHNDERPYGCRFCWKSFRDGGTLRKHERIHTGERPHACPLCTRAFNQKVVLREHVRWLHAANRQPNENGVYDCIMCEQKLSDKDDLCAHIVKHSDHLALLAKDASKKNIKLASNSPDTNKNVRKHNKLKDNNKVIIEIIPPVNISSSNVLIKDEKLLVKCDLCGDQFLNEDDLSEHVRIHI